MSPRLEHVVRRAHPGDERLLALIGATTFLETFAGVLPGSDIVAHCERQHSEERYAQWLANEATPIWIAETVLGHAPIGYLVLTEPDLPLADVDEFDLEVKRIYVLSRFHATGVGRELMDAAAEEARARGMKRLLLGVYGKNERALGFYKKAGFEICGERRFTVGANTYDDFVLARRL